MDRIDLIGLQKRFGGTVALKDATFSAERGEVIAICGENGAGKSTLMSLLAGSRQPSNGWIEVDGNPIRIGTPHDAFDLGIRTVYQELSLLPDLSVAENLFLGEMPVTRFGRIDWRRLIADAEDEMWMIGMPEIDVRRKAGDYPVAIQQMFEIAKAIQPRPRLLILDEPTGVLTQRETDLLFERIAELKADGTIIFYISHRLDEVLEISDRLIVLKDGATVDQMTRAEATKDRLIHSMVGRSLTTIFPQRRPPTDEVLLQVRNLSAPGVEEVSFDLHAGEILGFSGLVGSGRSETMRAVFGAEPRSAGTVELHGVAITSVTPRAAMNAGIGYVTEERKTDGLALDADVLDNAALASLDCHKSGPFLNRARQAEAVGQMVSRLDVRPRDLGYILRHMSGGNQQKVILAKWLLMKGLKVLILDEPTRGVDIATKVQIYGLIADLAAQGLGVVLISSETPEVLGLAHRILVMRSGRIAAELNPETTSEHEIFVAASGVEAQAA
ncbi:MAG: sugar ABC transporter ATP-binding protein [Pseudomonadota bacterium]